MRIVIDLQGAQASNRHRGIGRYSLSFAIAIARNRGEHDVLIALNGLFGESIDKIRDAFSGLLPQDNIRVWHATGQTNHADENNEHFRKVAEYTREAFLSSLRPDIVIVSSLFEGLGDDAVTSIGLLEGSWLTAVILYDLIPHIYPTQYLVNPKVAKWYQDKLNFLKRANVWLAISESSRQEGIQHLGLANSASFNVGADADPCFRKTEISADKEQSIRNRYKIDRPFVMYTGGIDQRKNISGLIHSYAKLPPKLRNSHQLAIVCSVQPHELKSHQDIAASCGLMAEELVFTGFVPEEDLIALYNLCKLFVFPSLHEGFGLPALEAIRCGAPTIGSKLSSLPEVIGWEDALFDPYSEESMTESMSHALSDDTFYKNLLKNGQEQSQLFSWDKTAQKSLGSLEAACSLRKENPPSKATIKRPKLAYISPLPPERSGIADYSAELIPSLSVYYDIDAIVHHDEVSDPRIAAHCAIRSLAWFVQNSRTYDRVLYHFGNSGFHEHMFALLETIPGIIVLHDFFLSGILAHMDFQGTAPGIWDKALYLSHGYVALSDRYRNHDISQSIWKYPCNLSPIQRSLGVIVHSEYSVQLTKQWYERTPVNWSVIPLLRNPCDRISQHEAKILLGFKPEDFLVCSFGMLGPTKLNDRLIQAWNRSQLSKAQNCHLIFVGANSADAYGASVNKQICDSDRAEGIQITGWVDTDKFHLFLAAADIGVQLRTLSRGETSAAILDCMNFGIASIVNANGSMANLDPEAVLLIPDDFSDDDLSNAMEKLWLDDGLRAKIGGHAYNLIRELHIPTRCASMYESAIEGYYQAAQTNQSALPETIARLNQKFSHADLKRVSNAVARSFYPEIRQQQLLIDISELVQRDAGTGIQRVVRSILTEWLSYPSHKYRVEPVFAHPSSGTYYYARKFTLKFLGVPEKVLEDEPIDFYSGDIFFALDLQPQVQIQNRDAYKLLRRQGVKVKFMIYDLLCVQFPKFFPPGAYETFNQWLKVASESDGVICISKTVADAFDQWRHLNTESIHKSFDITWFHLGSDVENSQPTKGMPNDAELMFKKLGAGTSCLMVGTLEPRKGHSEVLTAFDTLWNTDENINLVIVGKAGWLTSDLIKRIKNHPELGQRLFWLDSVSDEYLDKIYKLCDCIIAASYGEGFGLPLIEAARYSKPLFVRDIPIFREVAGGNATFFDASSGEDLANQLMSFIGDLKAGRAIKSTGIQPVSWSIAAKNLYALVTK